MCSNIKLALFGALLLCVFQTGDAMMCKKENRWAFDTFINCPQPGDPSSHSNCCGSDENPRCCENIFDDLNIDQETVDNIMESIPKILGILVGTVAVAIILCVVCCCCCPFCLLAKKRTASGQVHRGATEVTVTVPAQPAAQPLQPYGQQQQGYIQPAQGYPAPQPYPPQPSPGYPMQEQQQYPTGPAAPPMGGQPAPGYPDQPPPYAEKQPAFNPNYGS